MLVYVDTNVISCAEGSRGGTRIMIRDSRELLRLVRRRVVAGVTSIVAIGELERSGDRKFVRRAIRRIVRAGVRILDPEQDPPAKKLGKLYRERGAIAPGAVGDSEHLAWATIAGADVLASWNRRHLVRLRTRREAAMINVEMGYVPVDVQCPTEVTREAKAAGRG